MFTFGWLTVTAEDLAVWKQFPEARFTLVKMPGPADVADEYRLGTFEVSIAPSHSGG